MTTSGTTTFNLDLNDIMEEAFERNGAELRTGYDFKTARRSLNLLLLEWANRGINMWTIEQGTIPLVPNVADYDLPADTVDLIEHVVRTGAGNVATQADITISRISISTYSSIPNKLATGRPIQMVVHRNTEKPSVTVWPVPNASTPYTLVYWRLRRIQDAGGGTSTQDIPFRLLPALVAGLAYYLSLKLISGQPRSQQLKAEYEEMWAQASSEDREKAPVRFVPRSFRVGRG